MQAPSEVQSALPFAATLFSGATFVLVGRATYFIGRLVEKVSEHERRLNCLDGKCLEGKRHHESD